MAETLDLAEMPLILALSPLSSLPALGTLPLLQEKVTSPEQLFLSKGELE